MTKTKTNKRLRDFMSRVNKLTLGRATSDPDFGRVKCISLANYSMGQNAFLGRSGYGTRRFSVSKSTLIRNGAYTISGLRSKLTAAVA